MLRSKLDVYPNVFEYVRINKIFLFSLAFVFLMFVFLCLRLQCRRLCAHRKFWCSQHQRGESLYSLELNELNELNELQAAADASRYFAVIVGRKELQRAALSWRFENVPND